MTAISSNCFIIMGKIELVNVPLCIVLVTSEILATKVVDASDTTVNSDIFVDNVKITIKAIKE